MIYQSFLEISQNGKKGFAVLIDPDKYDNDKLLDAINLCNINGVDFIFIGGSLMTSGRFHETIKIVKDTSDIPALIFPGSNMQIDGNADALLLLSLISGRNPEYLIGQHVVAAPYIKRFGIETISTGYMLIESKANTTANYVSQSLPIPAGKPEIAMSTAMAGEMLGHKLIYLDGGSGAHESVSAEMIGLVKQNIDVPLIVGGGIDDQIKANTAWEAGADIVVIGNAIEKDHALIERVSEISNSVL